MFVAIGLVMDMVRRLPTTSIGTLIPTPNFYLKQYHSMNEKNMIGHQD